MDVHVYASLCRVIVTQIVTQLSDHPLRTDQREILGATRTARCSPTSPLQAAYCRSRPSRRASGARSRIPHRVTHRSPWGDPSRLQCLRGRGRRCRRRARRVRAACLLRACRCSQPKRHSRDHAWLPRSPIAAGQQLKPGSWSPKGRRQDVGAVGGCSRSPGLSRPSLFGRREAVMVVLRSWDEVPHRGVCPQWSHHRPVARGW
jgi:hypothetical protein